PALWAYVAVLALGIYLLSPAPQPWAMPAAGLVILAVLAQFWVFDYRIWRATHVVPNLDPIGSIAEIFVAVTLLAGYFGYERGRGETDGTTLRGLSSGPTPGKIPRWPNYAAAATSRSFAAWTALF
ncbi:MAG: hypothetical protein ACRD17_12955, partial [Terriglobales bacterium]